MNITSMEKVITLTIEHAYSVLSNQPINVNKLQHSNPPIREFSD